MIIQDLRVPPVNCFDISTQFWLGLQMNYDLDEAADKLAERLYRICTAAKPDLPALRAAVSNRPLPPPTNGFNDQQHQH